MPADKRHGILLNHVLAEGGKPFQIRCEYFAELGGGVFGHPAQRLYCARQGVGFYFDPVFQGCLLIHLGNHGVEAAQTSLAEDGGHASALLSEQGIGYIHHAFVAEAGADFAELRFQRAGNLTQRFHAAVFVEEVEMGAGLFHHVAHFRFHAFGGHFHHGRPFG